MAAPKLELPSWRVLPAHVEVLRKELLRIIDHQPRGQQPSIGLMPMCQRSLEVVYPVPAEDTVHAAAVEVSVRGQHNVCRGISQNNADREVLQHLLHFEQRRIRPHILHRLDRLPNSHILPPHTHLQLLHAQLSLYGAGEGRGAHRDARSFGDVVVTVTLGGRGILFWKCGFQNGCMTDQEQASSQLDAGHAYTLGTGHSRHCLHRIVTHSVDGFGLGRYARIAATFRYNLKHPTVGNLLDVSSKYYYNHD